MKILDAITPGSDGYYTDFWNTHDPLYLRQANAYVHRFQGSLTVTDLAHAFAAGKVCNSFQLDWGPVEFHVPKEFHALITSCGYDFRKVLDHCRALDWVKGKWEYDKIILGPGTRPGYEVAIIRRARRGTRTYSPFVKPRRLTESPDKWTIPHVIRALLNDQFQKLTCNGVYTDDYAHDNAVNFHQGDFSKNSAAFAKRILESPSGWWCQERNGIVSICCHHFDSNEFTFDLHAGAEPAVTQAPCLPVPEQFVFENPPDL